MPQQQIDVNQLNQAKGNVALTKELLTQAIEKSQSDQAMAQEAIKQAATEIAQAQTAVSQVQSALMSQQQSKSE
ncbi:hypothetical protein RZN22_07650 [Bacillaceae bacterium S4-13-58]